MMLFSAGFRKGILRTCAFCPVGLGVDQGVEGRFHHVGGDLVEVLLGLDLVDREDVTDRL
jgi:hypothetical protein